MGDVPDEVVETRSSSSCVHLRPLRRFGLSTTFQAAPSPRWLTGGAASSHAHSVFDELPSAIGPGSITL